MGKRRKSKNQNSNNIIINHDMNEDCDGAVRQLKPLPDRLEKRTYETDVQFVGRLNRLVGRALNEAQIEEKYDVDFCAKTGKNEFDELFKVGKTISKKKREKRKQRDKKRKEKKNLKKQLNHDEFKNLKNDQVKFGEVTHQPPDLSKITAKFDQQIKKMKQREKIKHFT